MKRDYPWKRYWYKRGITMPEENGFLKIENTGGLPGENRVFLYDMVDDKQCLILLGDAGLGKTTVMRKTVQKIRQYLKDGTKILSVDLRRINNKSELDHLIFQNPDFTGWLKNKYTLYLFLDSMDEGLLQTGLLGDLIIEKLKNMDISRLRLRIACRTGVFPSDFENELTELWGKEHIEVYQLAPLSKENVKLACEYWDFNAEEFLKVVCDRQIQSLAGTPVTLEMLLNMYKNNNKTLTSSKIKLYEEGCRILCSEMNPKRYENKVLGGDVPTAKRMDIAMLMGAITMFCNKGSFTQGMVEKGGVSIDKFLDVIFDKFGYTKYDVKEVLGSALFSEKQQNVYSWAHLSYAEFFAAKFVQKYKFTTEQILSLILQSEDRNERVIPQLHYTTAWIASFLDEVFYAILRKDPDVLCLADLSQMADRKREDLVGSLLTKYDSCSEYLRYGNPSCYKNLKHKNLTTQLTKFIGDENRSDFSKKIAIRIAYECRLRNMAKDVLNLAADSSYLAHDAIYIFFKLCGEKEKKVSLKILSSTSPDLAAYIFKNLYPNDANIHEIFAYLKNNYFCADQIYQQVTSLVEYLSISDLKSLMDKFYKYIIKSDKSDLCEDVVDVILIYSWKYIDQKLIGKIWIDIAVGRFEYLGTPIVNTVFTNSYHLDFCDSFKSDIAHRMNLLKKIWMNNKNVNFSRIKNSKLVLVGEDDLDVLLSYIISEEDRSYKGWLFSLLISIFNLDKSKKITHYESVYNELNLIRNDMQKISSIKDKISKLKKECDFKKAQSNTHSIFDHGPSKEKLINIVKNLKNNAVKYWPDFTNEACDPFYYISNSFDCSLTKSMGWKLLSEYERKISIDAANEFLLSFDEKDYNCQTSILPVLEAVQLVWETNFCIIEHWDSKMWEKMMDYFINPTSSNYAYEKGCFKLAYNYAPAKVMKLLLDEMVIKRSLGEWSGSRQIAENRIRICADSLFLNRIKETLQANKMALTSRGDLFKLLIELDSTSSEYLDKIINSRFNSFSAFKIAIEAVCSLMERDPKGGRNLIIPILNSSDYRTVRFMISALKRYSSDRRDYTFLKTWNMQNLGYLYLFIHNHQKELNKNWKFGADEWKKIIIDKIEEKNDMKSKALLFKLRQSIPDCKFVLKSWERVRMSYFREVWTPPSINVILAMLDNSKLKPITNGRQLLNALRDSLFNLEKDLKECENPLIELLWNKYEGNRIPKEEKDLSNLLKWYLKKDLKKRVVVLNREVQVSDYQGGIPGERIDIKVDVPLSGNRDDSSESLSAYIEMKGCWSPGLETSMEKQLVMRYMLNRRCDYGLYIIGWFNCPQWSLKDNRKAKAPTYSYDEAKEKFEKQALFLSSKYNININAIVLDLTLK